MAGHSKWAQIKRSKALVDAKRGATFTRISREILVAARAGGAPEGNFQLRSAICKAKAAGVPSSNIERAISKGISLSNSGSKLKPFLYEGFGPGGSTLIIETLTDNKNRTAANLRLALNKNKGNLGDRGSVLYLFEHRSEISICKKLGENYEEKLLETLLNINAILYFASR